LIDLHRIVVIDTIVVGALSSALSLFVGALSSVLSLFVGALSTVLNLDCALSLEVGAFSPKPSGHGLEYLLNFYSIGAIVTIVDIVIIITTAVAIVIKSGFSLVSGQLV